LADTSIDSETAKAEMSEHARQQAASALPSVLRRALNLEDFGRLVRPRLPRAVHGYVANGTEDDAARQNNRAAFRDWRMVPRVLRDVSQRSLETTLFGRRYAAPFGIAPMGSSAVIAYDGDNRLARGARDAGIPFALTANSVTPMEEVTRANPDAWFASYQSPDPDKVERMVARVAAAGIKVYVVTVDVPVASNREADRRAGFSMPLRPTPRLALDGLLHPHWLFGTAARTLRKRGIPQISNVEAEGRIGILSRAVPGITGRSDFTWATIDLIRRLWTGPLVVKGILSPEDARIARERGVDGIVVSNHGGRQLDTAVSSLEMLPDIKAASGGMAVVIDSGFRRGTDVLTALALGADFVLVGRPFIFACALAGEAGVRHAAALLKREIDIDLALLGLTTPGDIGSEHLRRADHARPFTG
jgi:L-lactate dehydrogenase (cytochrome)